MTEMVEKVAQAIYETEPYGISATQEVPWADVHESQKEGFRIKARAAMEATRTLTPQVLEYLQMNTEIGSYITENWSGAYDCMQEYQSAMIDAALKEQL